MVIHFCVEQKSRFLVLCVVSQVGMSERVSYLERRHCRPQIALGNAWEFLVESSIQTAKEDKSYLDTTFDHETFKSFDTSIDQGTQLILVNRSDDPDWWYRNE